MKYKKLVNKCNRMCLVCNESVCPRCGTKAGYEHDSIGSNVLLIIASLVCLFAITTMSFPRIYGGWFIGLTVEAKLLMWAGCISFACVLMFIRECIRR